MSYTIEKVYDSPTKTKTTVVLWVSRHPPLKAQIEELEKRLGSIVVYQMSGMIPNAEVVAEEAVKLNAKYVIPVLPLSMIARLSEFAKTFTVLLARMNNIATTRDPNEARRLVNESPSSRTLATYADGTVRVFEFERFERLLRIELVTEPF